LVLAVQHKTTATILFFQPSHQPLAAKVETLQTMVITVAQEVVAVEIVEAVALEIRLLYPHHKAIMGAVLHLELVLVAGVGLVP
jgi:hypothetical protein